MSNEDTSSADGAQAATSGLPQEGTPAIDGQAPVSQTTTTEKDSERDRIIEQLRKENAATRKKLSVYEEAERQAKEAQLSEIERITKQHADLQAQHDAYVKLAQERLVRYEVQQQAAKLGIIDPDAAAKLLDWSELEYDENGTPNNATKLLEKLLKNKPYLAPAPSQPDTQPSPEQSGTPTRRAAPAIPAMQPGRSNIPAPGAQPPGRIPRLSDPGVLVPPGTPSRYQP